MKKLIIFFLSLFSIFAFADLAEAALTCSVTSGSCSGTTIFKMQSTSNSHAELPSQSYYSYYVCCSGVTGLGNSCSGNYVIALRLSAATNAHVEKNTYANYTNNACLSAPTGNTVDCTYSTSCTGDYVCLASISGDTNAHVGDCSAYSTKVCCRVISPQCTGNLNVSISGTDTCTVTASLTASDCDGQAWQIKDDGTTKCSGTVSGSPYSYACSSWTVSAGTYTYNLYIGGVLKDSKSVTCSAAPFDFSISVNPTSGSVVQGGSATATVTATLTSGTTQSVTFAASLLDPSGSLADYGLSYSFTPTSCNPTCSSTFTINTSATTPTRTYKINVCGTGGGQNHCMTYDLNVTSAGSLITPPLVRTDNATNIATSSATLNGTLLDMGGATSCLVWFDWGTTTSYGNIAGLQTMTATGTFSANLPGLSPGTTYYFKARAKNGGSW